MTRRRFVQDRVTLEFHEVVTDYTPTPPAPTRAVG
jgi:hypothetical protein